MVGNSKLISAVYDWLGCQVNRFCGFAVARRGHSINDIIQIVYQVSSDADNLIKVNGSILVASTLKSWIDSALTVILFSTWRE